MATLNKSQKFSSHFSSFEQLKKVAVILLTLSKSKTLVVILVTVNKSKKIVVISPILNGPKKISNHLADFE